MLLSQVKETANTLAQDNQSIDMSTAQKNSVYLLPEGYAIARLVEYIETGMHAQEYQGQKKDPRREFRIGFALYGEGYQKEDGTPRTISSFSMPLFNNERSKAFKLFEMMNYKKDKKNFAQMLGDAFLVHIKHVKTSNGAMRARLDTDDVRPPIDPLSKKPYPVPEAPENLYRVLLWDAPTMEQWKSIEIQGTNDAGKSKNFLQEECLAALDFAGSKLEQMLKGSLPSMTAEPEMRSDLGYSEDDDMPF